MFKNYLIITWRNLRKYRLYSLINIIGLSTGMAAVIAIGLFVRYELSFDQYHERKDRIYRLANRVDGATYNNGIAKVSGPWGLAAKTEIPEVEEVARFVFYGQALVKLGQDKYYERGGFYADPSVFDIFSYQLISGNAQTALAQPNSVVITRSMADKYFDKEDPLNQILTFNHDQHYTVTGVIEDLLSNSHFTFPFLVSMSTYDHPDMNDWLRWNQFYTYLLLKPEAEPESVANSIDRILDRHLEKQLAESYHPFLQPVTNIHLHSKLFREISTNSDINYVYIFGMVAVFVLIIACVNFINLTTALATQRVKEVAIRKVTGVNRKLLIFQFLGEAIFLSTISVAIACLMVQIMLPALNQVLNTQLTLDFTDNPWLPAELIFFTLVVGVISGSYPAFVLSSYKTALVLKGNQSIMGNPLLRKGLVGLQFTISIFLLVAALIVGRQLDYIQNKDLGFDKEQIINISIRDNNTLDKVQVIKQELLKHPGILNVSVSANQPGGSDYGVPFEAPGIPDDQLPPMRNLVVDHDFLSTFEIGLFSGRGFDENIASDTGAYLLNQEAVRQLGWEDPLNHQLSMPVIDRPPGPVIGVVKDFHFRSFYETISPIMFFIEPSWASIFSVKVNADNLESTLKYLEETWSEFEPDYPVSYSFFDQTFEALHHREQNTVRIIRWFTILGILITCLGVFGLTTFTTERRTKEIGIRKVLGASYRHIFELIFREITWIILIAAAIASPLAYFTMKKWLQNFAYVAGIQWQTFILASLLVVVIAILTMSFQSMKAAFQNPTKSLRYE